MLISRRMGILVEDAIYRSGEDREETTDEFASDAYPGNNETGADFFFSLVLWLFTVIKKIKDS